MEPILKEIYQAVIDADQELVKQKVQSALQQGLEAEHILKEGMIAAMQEVGRLFEEGELYVPEMLISARAMQAGMLTLKPALVKANVKSTGKIVIGTVKGDLHDIGKNLVSMMLEGAAFEVHDLGTDVTPEMFVEEVKKSGANIVAMSALLTTTMPSMKATLQALEAAGLRSQLKVIVGGAPLTAAYAEQIGADGYDPDASRAVNLVKQLAAQ
jgi:5-methyltetrahydrofolate--homocysteine methyltransferase